MKIYKRMTALLLSLLAIVMLVPMNALAAGSIDLDRNVSLTVSCQDDKIPLVGAQFDIYLVATVDEYGKLTATSTFKQFNVDIRGKNDEAWYTLASTLEGYILRDKINPTDSGETDGSGLVSFPNSLNSLTAGVYLVLGHRHIQNGYYYDALPFMVMLPGVDHKANDWIYDVSAIAKHDSKPVPDEPDTDTRKVLKIWEDEGHEQERPQEVIVQLFRNREVYDTVTLNAANNWRYMWTDLDNSYKWTVVEKDVKGYTAEVTREGMTFVVTNTYDENVPDKPTTGKPVLPQTGQLWWPVPVMIMAGLLFVVIGLVRRRSASDGGQ